MHLVRFVLPAALTLAVAACTSTPPHSTMQQDARWLSYPGGEGVGAGKRVVLVAGDEEYRSEEALPMLARLLSEHHGFECAVLFSQDPETGEINPDESTHIPGLELIDQADLLILQLRFRQLVDEDMAHVMDFVEAGKPLFGIRTSTHAFNYKGDSPSPFAKWTWTSKDPAGGFGREILGETWVAHHGHHGQEATRGLPHPDHADHPVLRGVDDVFGPTDVYAIRDLPADALTLLQGQVLAGMTPDSPPVEGAKNNPMHPVAWLRERPLASAAGAGNEGPNSGEAGVATQRIFATTMGAATDLESEDLRRLFLNAGLWCLRMEDRIPRGGLEASMLGRYEPTDFGFGSYRKGLWPADYRDGTPE
ncbi:MAG: ThuA domain-containing protein [Planctomycetota bacterium]|nr:ThuA domain-containing protein [Planctomycetota bacterium]